MRLLSIAEAAELLCVAEKTLRMWVWQRKIPYIKLGASVRILEEDLRTWVLAHRVSEGKSVKVDSNAEFDSPGRE